MGDCLNITRVMDSHYTSYYMYSLEGLMNGEYLKDPCNDFWKSQPTGGRCRTGFLRAHGDMVKKKFFKKSKKNFFQRTPVLL